MSDTIQIAVLLFAVGVLLGGLGVFGLGIASLSRRRS